MTATRPQPRPGVLDIAPYVPGKSKAPGVARVIKLSSNESPLGPSPHAVAAYKEAAARLEDYPDGAVTELRATIGRAFGLDPARILCGTGSDDLLNLLAHAYLRDGDEAIYSAHGFLMYPIYARGHGAKPIATPEKNYTADVDAILAAVTERTRIVFIANPNNPTGTYVPFDEIKRLQRELPGNVVLVLDAAYAEYVQRNDYEAGIELVATCENVVMTRTFSKIHGLAGVRLGWMYGPAHIVDALDRVRNPFNVSTPAMRAGIAAIEDTAHVEKSAAHNARWLPWLTEEIGKLGLEVTPSVANFVLIHFPQTKGRTAADADAFLMQRGLILRRVGGLRPAQRAAHDGGHGGSQPAGGRRRSPRSWGRRRDQQKTLYNRLALIGVGLIGSSIARAAKLQGAVGSIVATARSPATRRRVAELGLADQVVETNAAAVEGADLVILCIPVGACGAVAKEIAPHLAPGATVSDVGSVKGAIVRDMGPHLPNHVHFVPAHPVAGTEYSGPDAGFAELFVNRWCILTPPQGADQQAVDKLAEFWRLLGANVETHGGRPPRPGARHHQPPAASDRLHHRRHGGRIADGDALGSVEILRRRLPRFHPHRGLRSDHVARRVPRQQGRGAWKCSAASTRTFRC